jgi:hypothetical protein
MSETCDCRICSGEMPDRPWGGGETCLGCGHTIMRSEECTRGVAEWVAPENAGTHSGPFTHRDCSEKHGSLP